MRNDRPMGADPTDHRAASRPATGADPRSGCGTGARPCFRAYRRPMAHDLLLSRRTGVALLAAGGLAAGALLTGCGSTAPPAPGGPARRGAPRRAGAGARTP